MQESPSKLRRNRLTATKRKLFASAQTDMFTLHHQIHALYDMIFCLHGVVMSALDIATECEQQAKSLDGH
eukprot:12419935-Karenia_brevis.AAC.1